MNKQKIKSWVIPVHAKTKEEALNLFSDPSYAVDNIMTEEEYKDVKE